MTEQELFNEYRKSNCKSFSDFLLNKIAELEKENAELKGLKDVATLIRANNDTVTTLMQLNNMLVSRNQQLTKAKDIIKLAIKGIKKIACEERCDFVNKEFFCDDCVYGKWIAKAEQFLKE